MSHHHHDRMTTGPARTGPTRRTALCGGLALAGLTACRDASGTSPVPESGTLTTSAPTRSILASASAPPRTVGFDTRRLNGLEKAAEALPQLHSLMVARDGEVALERSFRGPGLDRPANIKSASKTVLATVAGLAISKGILDGLDQAVAPLLAQLPGGAPPDADPRVAAVTIEHLLSMRAGLQSTSGRNYGAWAVSSDPVRHALTRPMVDRPGGAMIYSTGTSHLLSAALTVAGGRSTLALARGLLGDPLGISIPAWPRDPKGIFYGGNDMLLSPRDLFAFGELHRRGGWVGGAQLLDPAWIADAWTPRGRSRWSGDGYGLGWWLRRVRGEKGSHDVRYAWGYGGQMLFVVPDLGVTAVMLSESDPSRTRRGHARSLHALLRDHVIPAAEAGAGEA